MLQVPHNLNFCKSTKLKLLLQSRRTAKVKHMATQLKIRNDQIKHHALSSPGFVGITSCSKSYPETLIESESMFSTASCRSCSKKYLKKKRQ